MPEPTDHRALAAAELNAAEIGFRNGMSPEAVTAQALIGIGHALLADPPPGARLRMGSGLLACGICGGTQPHTHGVDVNPPGPVPLSTSEG